MEGAKIVVCSGEESTACSASHLARKKRVRCAAPALSALKKAKRCTPLRSAARSSRTVASPFSSSIRRGGWSRIVAARWTTVSTPRSAWRTR